MNKLSNNRVSFDENLTIAEIDAELAAACLERIGYPENVDGEVIYNVRPVAKQYRIVVGEIGNEMGHIEDIPATPATTEEAARAALKKALRPYGKDGWGRVEMLTPGGWMRI